MIIRLHAYTDMEAIFMLIAGAVIRNRNPNTKPENQSMQFLFAESGSAASFTGEYCQNPTRACMRWSLLFYDHESQNSHKSHARENYAVCLTCM